MHAFAIVSHLIPHYFWLYVGRAYLPSCLRVVLVHVALCGSDGPVAALNFSSSFLGRSLCEALPLQLAGFVHWCFLRRVLLIKGDQVLDCTARAPCFCDACFAVLGLLASHSAPPLSLISPLQCCRNQLVIRALGGLVSCTTICWRTSLLSFATELALFMDAGLIFVRCAIMSRFPPLLLACFRLLDGCWSRAPPIGVWPLFCSAVALCTYASASGFPFLPFPACLPHALGPVPAPGVFSPFRGFRFGEALHPGPPPADTFTCAIANPTSLHQKSSSVCALHSDLICLAETSAVSSVQTAFARGMRQRGYCTYFGRPVPPLWEDAPEGTTVRGAAGGVAITTCLPSRRSPAALPAPLLASTQCTEAFVRLGGLELRVLVLYGVPASHAHARESNNFLLQSAWERLTTNALPTLIAGDFNCDVTSLPAWEQFQAKGYMTAQQAACRLLHVVLEPTCRDATSYDSFLIPPLLQGLLRHAHVMRDEHLFDAHHPLRLVFARPSAAPRIRRWCLPRSWQDFPVDPATFEGCYMPHVSRVDSVIQAVACQRDVDQAFTTWAAAVEHAVDAAVRCQHQCDPIKWPQPSLPRAHKGRCQPPKFRYRQGPCLPRQGRTGDYMPAAECTSVKLRMRVRQCRRVQTFLAGMRKFAGCAVPCDAQVQQLFREWEAIVNAKGYGRKFSHWVLSWDCVTVFPLDWPTLPWLADLLQLLQFDCTALAQAESTLRYRRFHYQIHEDATHGHSRQAFSKLRGPVKPSLSCVANVESQQATARVVHSGEVLFRVPRPCAYAAGREVRFCDSPGVVISARDDGVQVAFDEVPAAVEGCLTQTTHLVLASELHAGFRDYWSTFWLRDTADEARSLQSWTQFTSLLARLPAPKALVQVDVDSLSAWRAVLRRSSARRATGPCGFAVGEIKSLPDAALLQLAQLFRAAYPFGLPDFIMLGRVSVLAKVEFPCSFTHGRPITVLSALYRCWGSLVATQLLKAWATFLPAGICGGVPGRSSHDLSYQLQHALEVAYLSGEELTGFTLDLTKCFNLLPRCPMIRLIRHLGCPPDLAEFWGRCLGRMQRHTVFHGDTSCGIPSTTGLPEGDALAVVAAVALCWAQYHAVAEFGLSPTMFVDNWSWTTESVELNAIGLAETQALTSALRLRVDWAKSFGWSVHDAGLQWWRAHGRSLVPPGATFQVLAQVRDLGAALRFRHLQLLGSMRDRLASGSDRLQRLGPEPRSVEQNAMLIQTSVWPAAFYGAEGHAIAAKRVHRLRSIAARALVGQYHATSPHLAMTLLSARVQDPECYLLTSALRALRRLWHVNPAAAQSLTDLACSSSGLACTAIGPATSLKVMLARNAWTIKPDGTVKGPCHVCLHLPTASSRDVAAAVNEAWTHTVRAAVVHRNGMSQVGIPEPRLTCAVLAKFSVAEQKVLSRHVTGSFLAGAAKSLWAEPECFACPWCGAPDTKRHRFLECPTFSFVRGRHPMAIDTLRVDHPEWIHCPFAIRPASQDITSLIFARRPAPDWPHEQGARLRAAGYTRLTLFTDGTCARPCTPAARHAAWAVVHDAASCEAERTAGMVVWREASVMPPCLMVCAQGLVSQRQTIARAELTAALQAVRLASLVGVDECLVVTDSTYVMRVLAEFESGFGLEGLLRSANLDLIKLLAEAWTPGIRARKVKSHVARPDALHSPDLWYILGNTVVDAACEAALAQDLPVVHELVDDTAEALDVQKDRLQAVFHYFLDLDSVVQRQRSAAKCIDPDAASLPDSDGDNAVVTAAGIQQWIHNRTRVWHGPPCWPPAPWERLAGSWGLDFCWMVWHWAQTLSWLAPGQRSAQDGTTTLELLCNFAVVTGTLPPMMLTDAAGQKVRVDSFSREGRVQPASVRYWLMSLTRMLQQLQRVARWTLLPGKRSSKVHSLDVFGASYSRAGVRACATMISAGLTAELIQQVLAKPQARTFYDFLEHHDRPKWRMPT